MGFLVAFLIMVGLIIFVEKMQPRTMRLTLDRTKECPPFGPTHVWYRDPTVNDNLRCSRCKRTWIEIMHDS